MPSEQTTAIVLRTVDFSETSSIVTLFTREFGKLGALAKGARRPKSPFESALDLLAVCRIVLLRKSSQALDLLTEAKLERRFRGAQCGLSHLYAGYYVAELLRELTDEGDPQPALYDLADAALAALAQRQPVGRLVLHFELTGLRLLGHLPSLEQCAECGTSVPRTGRVPFGLLSGGVLCARCRPARAQVVRVSAAVLELMAALAAEGDDWRSKPIEPGVQGELRAVMNRYLSHVIGRPPQMHRYLRHLDQP